MSDGRLLQVDAPADLWRSPGLPRGRVVPRLRGVRRRSTARRPRPLRDALGSPRRRGATSRWPRARSSSAGRGVAKGTVRGIASRRGRSEVRVEVDGIGAVTALGPVGGRWAARRRGRAGRRAGRARGPAALGSDRRRAASARPHLVDDDGQHDQHDHEPERAPLRPEQVDDEPRQHDAGDRDRRRGQPASRRPARTAAGTPRSATSTNTASDTALPTDASAPRLSTVTNSDHQRGRDQQPAVLPEPGAASRTPAGTSPSSASAAGQRRASCRASR